MTESTSKKAFGEENYNPDGVKAPVKDSDQAKIGEENAPLICKLVVDPRRPNEAYRKVLYHRYMVGPNPQKDGRFMLSPKVLQAKDPIADAYWDAHGKAKALKLANKEDSAEYRRLEQQKKVFGNHERYHLLVIPLNSTLPKVLTTVGMVVDGLFGREAWGDKAATKGLVSKMKDLKRNPFNLRNKTGWLKIWKTGQGIETRYHVEEYTVETTMKDQETGDDVAVKRPFAAEVSPNIFDLEIEQVPDLSKQDMDKSQMLWSFDECQAYVDSYGSTIPDRCKKQDRQQRAERDDEGGPTTKTTAGFLDEEPEEEVEQAPAPRAKPAAKASKPVVTSTDELDEVF